jgi:O-acetyl-ADP-ribose deacetylase (regulator of RNase III)
MSAVPDTYEIAGVKITLLQGDITKQDTDAIVNAANSTLMGGGGVDGAIHRAGGPAILEQCRRIVAKTGRCPTGEAVITTGGNLPAKHVIHTVGPVYRGGRLGEPDLLASAYRNSIRAAVENGLESIAFPSISTGAYRYPIEKAARVALKTVTESVQRQRVVREVRFVLFSDEDLEVYRTAISELAKN